MIYGTRNTMTLRFTSDNSNNYKGFLATYGTRYSTTTYGSSIHYTTHWHTTARTTTTRGGTCGGSVTVRSYGPQSISSPNWPYNYPNNLNCVWFISTSSSYRIRISFNFPFQTEEFADYVAVYAGSTLNPGYLMSK